MSRLDDRLLDHSVHELIARARELLSQVPEDTEQEADQRLDGTLGRAPVVLDYMETLLSSADPRLVTVSALDQLVGPLDQAIAALSTLADDPDQIGQLDSALETLLSSSQALAVASQLPLEVSEGVVKNFGAELKSRAEAITHEADQIKQSLEAMKAERDQLEQEAKNAAEQRRNELQGELERITEAINTEKGRLDSLVPNFETQFTQVQEGRAEEWEDVRIPVELRRRSPRVDDHTVTASATS